jgi:hypothetical protein
MMIRDVVGGKGAQQSCRAVESFGGRLVYVEYDRLVRLAPPPATGYQRFAATARYGFGSHANRFQRDSVPGVTQEGRFPGVAEWYFSPVRRGSFAGRQRYIAVSWLAVAFAFAALPAARVLRRWRRPAGPAFPVITPDAVQGSR